MRCFLKNKHLSAAFPTSVKHFLIVWCVCFFAVELFSLGCIREGSAYKRFDFRALYAAGYLARTQPSQLYNLNEQGRIQDALVASGQHLLAFYHPSYETLLLAPFSLVTYPAAYLAFIAMNMLLLMAAFFAARPAFSSITSWWQPRPGLMLFIFVPLLSSIALGQDSILALLFCCLAWRMLKSRRDLAAGCFLALALFKFQFVLPIAVLIAIRQRWRFSQGFLLTAGGLVMLSIGIVGSTGTMEYMRVLSGAASALDASAVAQHRMTVFPSLTPNIAGLLYVLGGRYLPSPSEFSILVGICSLGLFAWCVRLVRKCDQNVAFSIAILCGLLVSYHLYVYDLTLVILAVALLAERIHRYILFALFGLPIALLYVSDRWYFLLALPLGAMLAYASVSLRRQVTAEPEMAEDSSVLLKAA